MFTAYILRDFLIFILKTASLSFIFKESEPLCQWWDEKCREKISEFNTIFGESFYTEPQLKFYTPIAEWNIL